ncbi:hypothetical protein [Streptomyces microflavus]|uniref:hypothetical protein n=1 Tax=Streptomyces microflavus TaxID=1919 RepID=UPI002E373DC3|nr:hypothetical protein [Streptomyces microflavus]
MISARIRYALALGLALASGATSIACWVNGSWLGGLAFWLLSNGCVVACGHMQKTAQLLQQAHQAARVAALQAELLAGQHCGELKPPFSKVPKLAEPTECVLRPGHPGSHADEHDTRWWWIDTTNTPTTKETPHP